MVVPEKKNQKKAHITVKDLTMAYGSFVVQRDLTFTINRGDIFIIMGGSGCGKSTLMRHMVGLKAPAKGQSFLRWCQLLGYRTRRQRPLYAKNRHLIPERRLVQLHDPG